MDTFDLARKMKRLTAWLDGQSRQDSVSRQFHGVPFGEAYLTIDPDHQDGTASSNFNRVHLCGAEGMGADGAEQLIDVFAQHGVSRFFVWLSPGPDMAAAMRLLEAAGFSRNPWTGYPTLCREGAAPCQVQTTFDIRQIGPDAIARHRAALGETLWPSFAITAGKADFFHYMAFDGDRPVAIAALCRFEEIGYLMAAATKADDRQRGAQQALIAARVAQAEALGCTLLVSETLHMLEHSYRNLQRAGFVEAYDKLVYEWRAQSLSPHAQITP